MMDNFLKIEQLLIVAVALCGLVGPSDVVHAQRGDAVSQQQELQKALEMMKKQGMDAKTQKQMENMFKNMSEKGAKHEAEKLKKKQQIFERETAGNGTAQVEIDGKQYELKMTQCKITDRSTGHFKMAARQAPGKENVQLGVGGGGGHSGNYIQLSLGKRDSYEASGNLTFQLEEKTLNWEGQVAMGSRKSVALTIHMTCGAEMVDYAAPSQPRPTSLANHLSLKLGGETFDFESGLCSTKEYRTGNLIVVFEATSTGNFRGRPAIVLLSKSHPVESKQTFQNMDLLLGELTPEQRTLSPLKVAEELRKKVETFASKGNAAVQKKYQKKIETWQQQFDIEIAALKSKHGKMVPPDKMGELMDPFNKLMDAQGKEMDKVQEQVKAMRYPKGRSFGTITVKGQEIHFGGSKLSTQADQRAPEFQDLPEKTELWVTCGK